MAETLRDSYNPGGTGATLTSAAGFEKTLCQVFTASEGYKITKVGLRMQSGGAVLTSSAVELRTTAAGVPTATILTFENFNGNAVTTAPEGEWVYVDLPGSVEIVAGTQYAIVLHTQSAAQFSALYLRGVTSNQYPGGSYSYSGADGPPFTSTPWDAFFEVYGEPIVIPPTIDTFQIGSLLGSQPSVGIFAQTIGGGDYYPGDLVALRVEASGTDPLSYQWYKDGQPISGSIHVDDNIYAFYADASSGGNYTCEVTNVAGSATTEDIPVTMLDPGDNWTSPTGFDDPSSQWDYEAEAFDGDTSTGARDEVSGGFYSSYLHLTSSLGYCSKIRFCCSKEPSVDGNPYVDVEAYYDGQWNSLYSDDSHLGNQWYEVSFSSIETNEFRIRIRNSSGSSFRYVHIYEFQYWTDIPPTITYQTSSGRWALHQNVELEVVAEGDGDLSYQWYKDDVLISGGTSSTYSFFSSVGGIFTYKCIVSSMYGSDESDPIVVEITNPFQWHILNMQLDIGSRS